MTFPGPSASRASALETGRAGGHHNGVLPEVLVVVRLMVALAAVYLLGGAIFAPWFVWRGVGRIDPHAAEATPGFRLIIIPGVVALWPWLFARLLSRHRQPPEEWNAHRLAARRHHDAENRP